MHNQERKEMLSKKIVQHNDLTSARYDFSKCQLDIIFIILSILKKDEIDYTLHLNTLEELTGNKWNSKQLDEALDIIGSKSIKIYENQDWKKKWIFQSADYIHNRGMIQIKLSSTILPYLFELKKNFSSLELYSVLKCTSKYAKRIYGLCCQWKNIGYVEYEIIELKHILGLVQKNNIPQFNRIVDFKKRALEPAKEQINKYTDIHFEYELKKSYGSRSYDRILFKIQKSKSKIPLVENGVVIDYNADEEYQKSITYLTLNYRQYFTDHQIEGLAQKKTVQELEVLFEEINKKINSNKNPIKNLNGFVIDYLQRKGLLTKKA